MLKQVKYQETAVNELVSKTIKLLNSAGQRKKTRIQGTNRLRKNSNGVRDARTLGQRIA